MTYPVFESDLITEWSDGTTDVRFTDDEWAAMNADPVRFGLALECGHSTTQYNPAEGCMACFNLNEARDGA